MKSPGPSALPISSLPPIQYIEQHDPELISRQQRNRLPRIPRPTDAHPHLLTLEQLLEWKSLWASKHRPSTQSERDDHSECDRQIDNAASDSDNDWTVYNSEEEGKQANMKTYQRPLSPPSTPHSPQSCKDHGFSLGPKADGSKVGKSRYKGRATRRRPQTRSRGAATLSLHHRKGYLMYCALPWHNVVIGFDEYLNDVQNLESFDS